MRRILLALLALAFAGCSSNEKSYDISVICNNQTGNVFFICDPMQKEECDERTTRFDCYMPSFHIKCDKSTVQTFNDGVYFCSTHDGKSVRIMNKKI